MEILSKPSSFFLQIEQCLNRKHFRSLTQRLVMGMYLFLSEYFIKHSVKEYERSNDFCRRNWLTAKTNY